MSQEEQDAVYGRATREYKDAQKLCSTLTIEAHRIGKALVELGTRMGGEPNDIAKLAFTGQQVSLAYHPVALFESGIVDQDRISKLTDALRAALSDYHRLGQDVARFENG